MTRTPVYLKIDEIEIESPEQLVKFADNSIHHIETIFDGRGVWRPEEQFKTHWYNGKISFLQSLMIIDAEDEQSCISVDVKKPVNTEFCLEYWTYNWRDGISMQLMADVNLEELSLVGGK